MKQQQQQHYRAYIQYQDPYPARLALKQLASQTTPAQLPNVLDLTFESTFDNVCLIPELKSAEINIDSADSYEIHWNSDVFV